MNNPKDPKPFEPPDGYKWPDASRGGWHEIFGREDYWSAKLDKSDLPRPVILDIGANAGAFVLWAAESFPGAEIHAYEPHFDNFAYLAHNTAKVPNVNRCRGAVSDRAGRAKLYDGAHNAGERSLFDVGEQLQTGYMVDVVAAASLPPCDFLKIDTEGAEPVVLRNYTHLKDCKVVAFEWHRAVDKVDLTKLLLENGFSLVKDEEWAKGFRGTLVFVKGLPVKDLQSTSKITAGAATPHLFVSVLVGEKTHPANERCLERLKDVAASTNVSLTISKDGGTGVDRARNRQVAIARYFGKPDAPLEFWRSQQPVTHFGFIDSDIIFNPQDLLKMMLAMKDDAISVVCGAYPRKEYDWEQVRQATLKGVEASELEKWATSFILNCWTGDGRIVTDNEGKEVGTFAGVREMGTGFMFCKMEVFDKLLEFHGPQIFEYITDYPPRDVVQHMFFKCDLDPECRLLACQEMLLKAVRDGVDLPELIIAAAAYRKAVDDGVSAIGRYLTEDYRFCRLCTLAGISVYVMLECELGHIGSVIYRGSLKHALEFKVRDPETNETRLFNPTRLPNDNTDR
jgi:FkbM family methyltransferase